VADTPSDPDQLRDAVRARYAAAASAVTRANPTRAESVLPVLDIYRRYYGGRVALYILATFYVTMAAAGYVVEILFGALGIIPTDRAVTLIEQGPSWNYTSILNVAFLVLAAILVWRFGRSGGPEMLRLMSVPEGAMAHEHGGHETQQPPPPTAAGKPHSRHPADPSEHPHHHDH